MKVRAFPDLDMGRVFLPFVRLDESRGQETGGIGLGLAIARSIVRGHGGDILLQNRADGGLAATIQLPRRPDGYSERVMRGSKLHDGLKVGSDAALLPIAVARRVGTLPAQLLRRPASRSASVLAARFRLRERSRGGRRKSPLSRWILSVINHVQIAAPWLYRQISRRISDLPTCCGRFPSHDIGRSRQAASVRRVGTDPR